MFLLQDNKVGKWVIFPIFCSVGLRERQNEIFNSVGKNAKMSSERVAISIFHFSRKKCEFRGRLACVNDKTKKLFQSEKMRGPRFDCA